MVRPLRILLAVSLLAAALLSLAMAVSGSTLTYYLPPMDKGGYASERTDMFLPAVVASVVAGITAIATAVWVVLVARQPRPRSHWFMVLALVLVDLAVLVVTLGMDRPTF